jgi:2-polyprenyl-6-methoxyphenol hydroxylase-like FAD-dependent oxidoreductase
MTARPLTVLVIGGGIGGLALAQSLNSAGVNVEIYERNRRTDDWPQGHRLNINPVGSRSLYRCLPRPLWNVFVATSVNPGSGMAFHTERLTELVMVGKDIMTAGATDPADDQYAVSRAVLRNLLLAGMDETVRYGKIFERYQANVDGTVTALFADGSTATGDVLVGADGANSLVRKQYLPNAPRIETDAVSIAGHLPLNAGTRAWLPPRFVSGMNSVLPPAGSYLFTSAFDGKSRMTEAMETGHPLAEAGLDPQRLLDDLEDYVLWAFIAHSGRYPASVSTMSGEALKSVAEHMIRHWHPDLRRMVASTDPATMGTMRFKSSTIAPPWGSTPVTMIGDAIHNMPPVMGLGANMALRDAAELSDRLAAAQRGEVSLLDAISRYENEMRDYGFGAVRTATKYTETAISNNLVARRGMRGWLRLCGAVPALKRMSFGKVWSSEGGQVQEKLGASV